MQDLLARAEKIGALLKARGETVAVVESSAGGLISAALLSVAGASVFFQGGGVIYTRIARTALLGITNAEMEGVRSSSEPYARLLARTARHRLNATWGIAETGAAGPTGNSYGDAAGHSCLAVAGPVERVITLETGSGNRVENMRAFGARLLDLFASSLDAQS